MNNYSITVDDIHSATNGGLDIYTRYITNLPVGVETGKKPFKYRDTERSPSSYIRKNGEIYFLVDFGGKSFSPVSFVCDYHGLEYGEAIKKIADDFGLSKKSTFYKPTVEFKDTNLTSDHFKVNVKSKVENYKTIGRFVDKVNHEEYFFYEVESYEKVFISEKTNRPTLLKVVATENYPIYCYSDNLEVWAKLYEPKAVKDEKNRSNKHSYLGKKPEVYVHGLNRLLNQVDENYISEIRDRIRYAENEDVKKEYQKELDDILLDEVYICSGGSDGLNVASLGKNAIWCNSEKEKISFEVYSQLKNICKAVYNIPDIDSAGRNYGNEYALQFWDMKSIWLNAVNMVKNGKDFRDWLDFYKSLDYNKIVAKFDGLKASALRCKFFDSSKGRNGATSYKLNLSNLHYFLNVNNFYSYVQERKHIEITSKEEIVFISIGKNNIIDIVSPQIIRTFCENYLKDKGCNLDVINMVKSSNYFGTEKLEGLPRTKLNFKNTGKDFQLFFFKNKVVKVTAQDINVQHQNKEVYAFNKAIIEHSIMKDDQLFEFYKDENDNNRVKIHYKNCEYINYLINTSRVFWRKDLEEKYKNNLEAKEAYFKENQFTLNGSNLTLSEQITQEQHFLNKCFAIGYLLHRFKRMDYAKMVYAMDDLVKDSNDDANGRSGKSIFGHGLKKIFKNTFTIDGKDKTITSDKHIFHGFDENNEMIEVEDADMYLDLKFFYVKITTDIRVNPKNSKPYSVPFHDAAKMYWTTNYGKPHLTGSDIGRLLFVSFSDFYHEKTDGYHEKRSPSTDFGHQLFDDWDNKQWNLFYNFLMQCTQFYLQNFQNEFGAPMDNIVINNLNAGLGDTFKEWAYGYFTTDKLDVKILKEEAYDDYYGVAKKNAKNINNFKKAIKDFCNVRNRESKDSSEPIWIFNPAELANSQGRFVMNVTKSDGKNTTKEFIYIKTKPVETITVDTEVQTDLPF